MAKLVIVESPAKAKTIGKYLGDDYEVTASMGHIRDLPASQLGIDVEHGYAPQYISIKGKEKLIKELKSKAKHADGVLLATDPDREGEAISWHLANILGLDPHEPNRVTFDEITKKGVQEGMAHPRTIDMDLFNAQQRGTLIVTAGEKVYEGEVVGYTPTGEDITVNVCKTKHLTNTRASGSDDALRLIPVTKFSLEGCLEFLAPDELLEVTPENLRIRKRILDHDLRMKATSKKSKG